MKTIEERAMIAGQAYQFCKTEIQADHKIYEQGYIQGAAEQEKITIDKAWKWIEDNLFEKDTRNLDLWERDFRKAMEN